MDCDLDPKEISFVFHPFSVLLLTEKINPLPHQLSALYGDRKVYDSKIVEGLLRTLFPQNMLIADETGLGKTIILGYYLLSLKLRGIANKVLILTPKSIIYQWMEELDYKFRLEEFKVVEEGRELNKLDRDNLNIIASIDLMKFNKDFLEELKNKEIDITIIDEAHHVLSTQDTLRRQMMDIVKEKSKEIILSTATPYRGHEREDIVSDILGPNYLYLRRIKEDIKLPNGRSLFPSRYSISLKVYVPPNWRIYYDKLNNEINKLDVKPIVKLVLKKRLASSIYSFLISYNKILSSPKIDEEYKVELGLIDYDKEPDTYESSVDITINEELFQEISGLLQNEIEPKEKMLMDTINTLKDDSKLIVFTEYVSTLYRLHSILEKSKIPHEFVHGELPLKERNLIINNFRQDDKIKILLATDVAGEGLNLQVAHTQINYDLPWSPLRLEQRFGRIHRYGQKKNVVYLYNFYVESTIDEKIVNTIINKLDNIVKKLGDWVFDYIGTIFSSSDMDKILENNSYNINVEERVGEIQKSLANPIFNEDLEKEINKFVNKYKNYVKNLNLYRYKLYTKYYKKCDIRAIKGAYIKINSAIDKPWIFVYSESEEEAKETFDKMLKFYHIDSS